MSGPAAGNLCGHARLASNGRPPEIRALPRYYFDIENGSPQRDETGSECRDLEEVRAIAVRTLTGIAAEDLASHDRHRVSVAVRDSTGAAVLDMTLALTTAWSDRARA